MKPLWQVRYELHGKKHTMFVNAVSELDALMEARTKAKDWCNTCHVICIARA